MSNTTILDHAAFPNKLRHLIFCPPSRSPSSVLLPSALQAVGPRPPRLAADLLLQPAGEHNGCPPGQQHRDGHPEKVRPSCVVRKPTEGCIPPPKWT
ncbi:hypothetical protein ElyMa_001748300 [Elysia marginata]|uniref:Uncharacterized protein n=1 Tax=Elysia marginata TaxID=1093978 RepID=A0AAV4E9U9_9GAST|nr:hypothetical protein ElyMa_001748300 [Elysia marginata]